MLTDEAMRAKRLGRKRYPTDVTDEQWRVLARLLARPKGPGRPTRVDLRAVVDALLYQARTGCQWRLLPQDFPDWQAGRYYFDKWGADGTWAQVNQQLVEQVRAARGRAPRPTGAIIDSQSVKTTEAGGERGFDGGKKGRRPQTARVGGHRGAPAAGGGWPGG